MTKSNKNKKFTRRNFLGHYQPQNFIIQPTLKILCIRRHFLLKCLVLQRFYIDRLSAKYFNLIFSVKRLRALRIFLI